MFFVILAFSSGYSPSSRASDTNNAFCESSEFSSRYFLLEANDVGLVSTFFGSFFEQYFQDFDPFLSKSGERSRIERYFDSRDLDLHENDAELVLIVDKNLPSYRAGRERIVFRDEINGVKFEFEVKKYNKKISAFDKHALFGKVRRKDRQMLIDKLKSIGLSSVNQVDETLQVNHEELVVLFSHFGTHLAEISLDKFHISNFGLPNTYTLLKFEIFKEKLSGLKANEKKQLNSAFCDLVNDFQHKFSSLKPVGSFGYEQYTDLANKLLPSRSFYQRYPVAFEFGQIFVLVLIGFLILYLFLGRYSQGVSYRESNSGKNLNSNDHR